MDTNREREVDRVTSSDRTEDERLADFVRQQLGVECTAEEVADWPPLAKQLIKHLSLRLIRAAFTGEV
jgi:hypothetical protein